MDSCPLCGEARTSIYIDGEDRKIAAVNVGSSRAMLPFGQILHCDACSFTFRRYRPDDESLELLYREAGDDVYESEASGRARTAKRRARIVSSFCPSPGRLLDVGCASGAFLSAMAAAGWMVEGVEPGDRHFKMASRVLAGRVQNCTLQHAQFSSPFDVVTLWDVLEHVRDPVGFLRTCAHLARPGGRLFINVPDIESLQARLLGRRWPLLLAEHLNYFTLHTLVLCARQAGLKFEARGRMPAAFSLEYLMYRLSQHSIPGASLARRWMAASPVGRLTVPVWMGECLAVLRRD